MRQERLSKQGKHCKLDKLERKIERVYVRIYQLEEILTSGKRIIEVRIIYAARVYICTSVAFFFIFLGL